jgi:hypothetical protein
MHTLSKRAVVAGALLAAASAIAGVSSAQSTTTTTTTPAPTAKAKAPTTATPEMIADAVARSKARRDKFLATGTPEQFGSEEPYTATTK